MDTTIKNVKLVEFHTKYATVEYANFEDDLVEYQCLCFNKNYRQKFDKKLKERFFNTHKVSNQDNNKFISLMQKGFYPSEYMDNWKKCNKTSLLEKEASF